MRSRAFAILSALSLGLGLAMVACWARGYVAYDCLTLKRGRAYSLTSSRGAVTVIVCSRYTVPMGSRPPFSAAQRWPGYSDTWQFTWDRAPAWSDPSVPYFPGIRAGPWWQPNGGDLGVEAVDSG